MTNSLFYFNIKPTPKGTGDYKMSKKEKGKPVSLFEKPIYVTKIKRGKARPPDRSIDIPRIVPSPKPDTPEYYNWHNRYFNFLVPASKYRVAKKIAERVREEYDKREIEKAIQIFEEELEPLRSIPLEERDPKEQWAWIMAQKPKSIGGPNKSEIEKFLSERYFGKVLEPMCGFNSYFIPSRKRRVIALDFCEEALERYEYPKRPRILFDLNDIDCKNGLGFFKDGTFNNVAMCFSFPYFEYPGFVFKEFRRILKLGGRLCLVENSQYCYEHLAHKRFSVEKCVYYLKLEKVGFKKIYIQKLPIVEIWESGTYYFIEAIK